MVVNKIEVEVYENESDEEVLYEFLSSNDKLFFSTNPGRKPGLVVYEVMFNDEDSLRDFLYWLYRTLK